MGLPKITYKKIILASVGWWLLLVLFETYLLINTFGFSVKVALADAVNTGLLIATAGFIMINSLRYYRPDFKNSFYLAIWSVGLAVGCVVLHPILMKKLFPGDDAYLTFLSNSDLTRGLFAWLIITLIAVMSWIWFYFREEQEAENRKTDTEKLSREAELSKLRQQLQPHFLFNSLNSISALAGTKPEEARKMIQQLSDFLRGTIKKDDQQLVTLEEELKHLQLYLDIEKVRFGHRLKTEVNQDEYAAKMILPSLLLQPLVENAIKFGLYDTIGEITIRINATTEDNNLTLRVENPFDPTTSLPKQGTGFGLSAVQRRLYLLYARNDLLVTQHHENIFTTSIKIPQPL